MQFRSLRNTRVGQVLLAIMAGCLASGVSAAPPKPADAPRLFAERWIDGTLPNEPQVQVQTLDPDTFVIRQSVRTNFEAPFLYLLFGRDRALLLDSGAGGLKIRPPIDAVIAQWLKAHHRRSISLVVAHSHSHGDHVAGDQEFRDRPDTTVVGLKPAEVAGFFGIKPWPDAIGHFDLGGRDLRLIPTPGHQVAHIMVYDPRLKLLLSGDALYPGRLYIPVNHMDEARASIDRLSRFAATHPIRAALGAHIEMTDTPGKDYGHEAPAHPSEHRLELPASSIGELQAGLRAKLDDPRSPQVHDDFIVTPVPPRPE